MKKNLFMIGLFLIAILALGVSAASVDLSGKTSIDKTQKPTGGFSDTFTITNNGTAAITDLKMALSGTELNNFNISTLPKSLGSIFTLAVNESVTIDLTGKVPKSITTKSTPYTAALKIYSGSTELGSIALNIIADSQLDLDKVKAKVDGKSKSVDPDDTIKDVKPGSKVEFTGEIQNTFTDDDDIEIEDVEVEITIEGIDDDEDLEESEDVGDIDADDKESFKVEFEVPEDVEDGDYDVIIAVDGEDENGAKHSVEWKLTLSVEKEKHDIWITKAAVSPSKVGCSRNIKLDVGLKNQGTSDEDEVVLRVESAELGIASEDKSIPEIEEGTGDDTEYEKTYTFDIDDKVKAGTYQIKVTAYYNTDDFSDSETVDLTVEKCEVAEETKPAEEVVVVTPPKTPTTEEEPEILTTPVTETTEVSLLKSNTYLILLAGAVGVAVIVIIIMIIVIFSMKKRV